MSKYLFFLFSITMFSQQPETQQYIIVKSMDGVDIRYYPPSMKAKVTSNNNFSKLFKYISGHNLDNTKIAMTTPVYMTNKGGLSTMEFVLPSRYLDTSVILPKDNSIEVYRSKEGVFAAISYGGYSNSEKIAKNYRLLIEKLTQENIMMISDSPIVLSYDAPYKVFNRRNEILLEVVYGTN
ncbi:MAG: heme-binding protein [Bacteroidetes bacterium]|jgi:hypothetical protein|nr:heme-binding protein [Bacteroidota bacterium]